MYEDNSYDSLYNTTFFYQYASLSVKKRLCNIMCRVIVVHVCYRLTLDF